MARSSVKRGRQPKKKQLPITQKPEKKKPDAPATELEPGVNTYVVRKGVPMPLLKRNRRNRFPFDEMTEIGDSFVVPKSEITAARQVMKEHNKKFRAEKKQLIFESRTLPDGSAGFWLQEDRWQ